MRSTGHSIALSDSMLFVGFGPVLTLKLISHAPIPENTRTSQHWKLRLQVCEDQPVIVWREGINFFHQGRDQLGGGKPARTADLLLLWALNCFGLETFASSVREMFLLSFLWWSLTAKWETASGFVRHRNSYLHQVMLLNSCSSASYQWFLLAILSMKLIFIYL